jgi:hypothetical protein
MDRNADRKKALAQWKEDHFGSSQGFEEEWGNDLDWHKIWQDRFVNDTQDLY